MISVGGIYFVRNFLQAIQRSDVVQCVYGGRQPAMETEDLHTMTSVREG